MTTKRVQKEPANEFDEEVTRRLSLKLKVVNPYDVLKKVGSTIVLGGAPVTPSEISALKQEVIVLKNLRLWSIFQETLKQYAIEKTFEQSEKFEDVLGGKMMGHNLGIIQKITEIIENI